MYCMELWCTFFFNILGYVQISQPIIVYLKKNLFNNIFSIGQSLTTKLVVTLGYNLINIFLLKVNFDKSTIRLHLLLIPFILTKFLEN